MKRILSMLVGLVALCVVTEARAVPGTIAFTGRLSTSSGPVNGTVNATFTLYNAATAGSSVWTENRAGLTANAGLLYVDLGAATTLDEMVFDGTPLFLEIIINGETLSPRLPMRSVAFAFRAAAADSADTLGSIAPGDVVTTVTASGGIAATRTGNTVSLTGTPVTGAAPIAVTGGAVGLTTCAANQIYKMVGGAWQCAADTNTTYTAIANGGVLVNGSNQIGLISTCASGQVLKAGATAGTWACAADTDTNTTYTAIANGGVLVNGSNQIGLISTCASGQVLKAGATAGTWACAADTDTNTTYTAAANGGVVVNGSNQIGLLTTCASGQVLKAGSPGGIWSCAADTDTDTGMLAANCTWARTTSTTAVASVDATCPVNKYPISGGCDAAGTATVAYTRPFGPPADGAGINLSTDSWRCQFSAAATGHVALALCCELD